MGPERSRERVCFRLHVRPERIEEYKARHAAVWPEMVAALRDTGWHNYSLFLAPDGLLIGYFETDDLDAAVSRMAATDVNARWQADMAPFFAEDSSPAGPLPRLAEVFNLDQHLDRLAHP